MIVVIFKQRIIIILFLCMEKSMLLCFNVVCVYLYK